MPKHEKNVKMKGVQMHYLRIAPIEGFMHELSYPERLDDQMVFLDNNVLDGNTFFGRNY